MNIKDHISLFFHRHQDYLTAHYPGLSLHRLLQELYELPHFGIKSFEEFGDQYEGLLTHEGYQSFLRGLQLGTPIEYLTGRRFFYQSDFLVQPGVFIPRSETEVLVDEVRQEIKRRHRHRPYTKDNPLRIVDVYLGTGCVLLSIVAQWDFPIHATGIDIDEKALENSMANYHQLKYTLGPQTHCQFLRGDRLGPYLQQGHGGKTEMVVTNPPYIKSSQKDEVHPQVLRHEPHQALFLENADYESWFRELFRQAKETLTEGGLFFMEGHEFHLQNLADLGTKEGFISGQVLKDLTQRDRFYRAIKKSFNK